MPDDGVQETLDNANIEMVEIQEEMERSFLDYAMSVITARALPDARDGLKPVHRRILYAMYEAGTRPDRKSRKSSQTVGEVMGKYHPHGDTAIYDAMARMAQDFSLRYPLVDGHGNFGSPDPNDRPAAARYTEAKLAPLAMELIGEIDEETVDKVATYDGENEEPEVLPARFPNLFVNGGGGIAVGMATNIPPHNLREVIDAAIFVLENPRSDDRRPHEDREGPRLPDRRVDPRQGRDPRRLHDRSRLDQDARESPRSKRASAASPASSSPRCRIRRRWRSIGQKIAELVNERRIEGVRDVRNESAGDDRRLVVELKRDANPNVVLNQLYKHTPMQTSFAANIFALVDGVPRLLSLDRALPGLRRSPDRGDHARRTEFRLRKAKDREHIVEGLVKALDMIDAIIALIRGAADVETARTGLMAKPFEFSEIQANYILDMQLRRLTQLEGKKLRDELEELRATIKELKSILGRGRSCTASSRPSSPSCATSTATTAARSSPSTPARSTCSTSSRTKRSSSSSPRRATSRPLPPTRSAGRAAADGRAREPATATTTTSISCSPPPRTRICCCSRTAAGCTGSARTRSR